MSRTLKALLEFWNVEFPPADTVFTLPFNLEEFCRRQDKIHDDLQSLLNKDIFIETKLALARDIMKNCEEENSSLRESLILAKKQRDEWEMKYLDLLKQDVGG